jgi:hypothetical protein
VDTATRYLTPDGPRWPAIVRDAADIYSALAEKLAIYGAQVINIDMRNFAFQESYMRAINSKVEQEQLRPRLNLSRSRVPHSLKARMSWNFGASRSRKRRQQNGTGSYRARSTRVRRFRS